MFLLLLSFLSLFSSIAYAAEEDLPRSRDLDIDIPNIIDQIESPPKIKPILPSRIKPKSQATESFVLKKIIIDGSKIYKTKDLYPVFSFFLNKPISINGLNKISARIERFYQKEGWLATRVILPAQSIKGGIVRFQVFEGSISDIIIKGDAGFSLSFIKKALNDLKTGKPTKISDLEKALGRLQKLSHLRLRPQLKPSESVTKGIDLIVEVTGRKNYSGLAVFSNTGNESLGVYSASLSGSYNFANNSVSLYFSNSILDPELSLVGRASYEHQLGLAGHKIGAYLGGNRTKPNPEITGSETDDKGVSFGIYYNFPVYSSAVFNLETQFDYDFSRRFTLQNSAVNTSGDVNIISLGALSNYRSPWGGYSTFSAKVRQGVSKGGGLDSGFRVGQKLPDPNQRRFGNLCGPIGGGALSRDACRDTNDVYFDRLATWFVASFSHLQPLVVHKGLLPGISLHVEAEGQYALKPLINSERISFGRNNIGRGFPGGRISSDHGWGISTELRSSWGHIGIFNQRSLIQDLTVYNFFDFAQVFQLVERDVPRRQLYSTGLGVRARWVDKFYLDASWAHALNSPFQQQVEKGNDDFIFRLYYIF